MRSFTVETLLHSLERASTGIGLHINANKMEYICFNKRGEISALNGKSLKLVDKFAYLGSSVSSTETNINTWLSKAWTAIHSYHVIWKLDLTDKIKRCFFQAAVVSILLYERNTWTLTKRMEKKLDGNYTRMLRAILNKSWMQNSSGTATYHPSRKLFKLNEPDIHFWRSRDELISDVLLLTLSHGRAKAGWPATTYIQ